MEETKAFCKPTDSLGGPCALWSDPTSKSVTDKISSGCAMFAPASITSATGKEPPLSPGSESGIASEASLSTASDDSPGPVELPSSAGSDELGSDPKSELPKSPKSEPVSEAFTEPKSERLWASTMAELSCESSEGRREVAASNTGSAESKTLCSSASSWNLELWLALLKPVKNYPEQIPTAAVSDAVGKLCASHKQGRVIHNLFTAAGGTPAKGHEALARV